jgi:hypothetical protein
MAARIKVRDIRHLHTLREQVEPKWYESFFYVILFPAAFGLIFVVIKGVESGRFVNQSDLLIARFFYVWFVLFVLGLSAMIELILARMRALREITTAMYDEIVLLHRAVEATQQAMDDTTEKNESPAGEPGGD